MLLYRKDTCNATLIDSCNMWILSLCKAANSSFLIGVVYIKPSFDMNTTLSLLQEAIQSARDLHPQAPLLLLGDFNARIGTFSGEVSEILEGTSLYSARRSLDLTVNQRGRLLTDFMVENGLIVLNGRTTGDYPGQLIFVNNAGGSTIDLMMISAGHVDLVNDLSVSEGPLSSDHFPILFSLNLQQEPGPPPAGDTSTTTQTWLKWVPSRSDEYGELLSSELAPSRPDTATDVNSLLSQLVCSIGSAAFTLGMSTTKARDGRGVGAPKHAWFDCNCRAARTDLRRALREARSNHFSTSARSAYLLQKKSYKALLAEKRNSYEQSLRDKFASVKCSKDFWQAYNSTRPRRYTAPCIDLPTWETFDGSVFPPKTNADLSFVGTYDPTMDGPISELEVGESLKRCKSGKAPGPDGISPEFLKHLPAPWIEHLTRLFNAILDTETIPPDWCHATLTMLHKKGDKTNPRNYRGIASLSCILKTFTLVMNARLLAWAETNQIIPEAQSGFRKSKSCLDNIFVLLSAAQQQLSRGTNTTFALFIDFARAFDSVSHELLFHKLHHLGCSAKFIRVISSLYSHAVLNVKVGSSLWRDIPVTEGVLQGEVLSPLLFSIFLSDLEQHLRSDDIEGISLNSNTDLLLLMFADDIVIFGRSPVILQKILASLERYWGTNKLSPTV